MWLPFLRWLIAVAMAWPFGRLICPCQVFDLVPGVVLFPSFAEASTAPSHLLLIPTFKLFPDWAVFAALVVTQPANAVRMRFVFDDCAQHALC